MLPGAVEVLEHNVTPVRQCVCSRQQHWTNNTGIFIPVSFLILSSASDWREDIWRPCRWWSLNCLNVEPDKSLHQWIQFPQYCVWCGIFPSSLWQPYIFIVRLTDLWQSDDISTYQLGLHSHSDWGEERFLHQLKISTSPENLNSELLSNRKVQFWCPLTYMMIILNVYVLIIISVPLYPTTDATLLEKYCRQAG